MLAKRKFNPHWTKRIIIHPLILATYPILALLAFNITQINPVVGLRPWFTTVLVVLIAMAAFSLLFKDIQKFSLVLSLGLVLFFSYGHIYGLLETNLILGFQLGRHRFLAPLWLLIFGIGTWLIYKKLANPQHVNRRLNVITAILLLFPVIQIGMFYFSTLTISQKDNQVTNLNSGLSSPDGGQLPDIYLIILDGYARNDVLESSFDYDNQAFLDELRQLDFYVADCSLSNYDRTELSLASVLNYDFVNNLVEVNPKSTDHSPLWPYIKQSTVRKQLEALGYQTVAFETGYPWSQLEDASTYLKPPANTAGLSLFQPFEALLIKTTAGLLIIDIQAVLDQNLDRIAHTPHYNRQLFVLDSLEEISSLKSPKFVFVHVLVPHEPYVFTPDGGFEQDRGFYSEGWGLPVDASHRYDGYRNQIAFVNSRIIPSIKNIIQSSENPPIIVLQADHGVRPVRNAILNTYYLPGNGANQLYPNITPVNTFRIILNTYFGGQYELLSDLSYSSASIAAIFDQSPEIEAMPGCQD